MVLKRSVSLKVLIYRQATYMKIGMFFLKKLLIFWLAMMPAFASPFADKLDQVSAKFIDRPYKLDPLGEGESGKYDTDPLERFDAFDCTTYVETMMALALADDESAFKKILRGIRYKNGVVSYPTRNHFPEADWIPNNAQAGILRDISSEVAAGFRLDLASAVIDKQAWYEHMELDKINLPTASLSERENLLGQLKREGRGAIREVSELPYIHLETLFAPNGEANAGLFDRIPSGSIVNIVRPNWDLVEKTGTHLNISHQGLVFKKNGELFIRHASSSGRRVMEQSLIQYLRAFIGHSTIKGINLLEVKGPNKGAL